MLLLHESTVLPAEIDTLGHMNVRYYMERMDRANVALMTRLGVNTDAGVFLRRTDTYSRFRREQFEGAALHTLGGVLDVSENGMRSFVEIRNATDNEVAASFVAVTRIIDANSRQPRPFPVAAVRESEGCRVTIPPHGQPRSISLDPPRTDVSVADLDRRIPDSETTGMISGRREALVEQEDVDAEGWLREDIDVMFLPFLRAVRAGGAPPGPPVFRTADGRRVGWAVMESRNLAYARPRLGERLVHYSADLALAEKSRLSRRWALSRDTGQLLGISDTVGICIDLDARRAVDWPEEIRRLIEANLQSDLA
ncbi:MAG: acyl-ACP thioesterase [Pseudomonadales bacterium]|nr:acyl-ACP thioesterase [Pseudomonadales bacterium]MCP5185838.1 acyl-ACP thioesterase [Pseudomonadales bacterium]